MKKAETIFTKYSTKLAKEEESQERNSWNDDFKFEIVFDKKKINNNNSSSNSEEENQKDKNEIVIPTLTLPKRTNSINKDTDKENEGK